MSLPQYINTPVLVQARFTPEGTVLPTAFIWQDRTRYVADHGRHWREEVEGTAWDCFLVRTATQETFELRYAPSDGRWLLARAWQNPTIT